MALIALVATTGVSPWQRKMCERARRYLDEQKVPYEVVDAKVDEVDPSELPSETLTYPQFFLQYGNGEITHLGGLDDIKHLLPVLATKEPEQPSKPPGSPKQAAPKANVARSPPAKQAQKNVFTNGQDASLVETLPTLSPETPKKRSKPRKLFQVPSTKHSDAVVQAKQAESQHQKDDKPVKKAEPVESFKSTSSPRSSRKPVANKKSPSLSPGKVTAKVGPSVAQGASHIEAPPLDVVRVVKGETYQRPDRTRGTSYDDDHSSISDSHSWADRDVQRIPTLRPSSTRGHSFDKDEPELPSESENTSRPSTSKGAGKAKAKRPVYVRSISFDESSFDESSHSRREMAPVQSVARSRSLAPPMRQSLIRSMSSEACNQAPNAEHSFDPAKIDRANTKSFDSKFTIAPGPSWLYSKDEQAQRTNNDPSKMAKPPSPKPKAQPAPMPEPVDSANVQGEANVPDKKPLDFDGKTTFSIAAGPDWLYA